MIGKMPLKVVQLVDASVQNNNNNNSLPDKKELYDVYLSAIDEVDDLTTGFTQLCFAAMHDDVEYIKNYWPWEQILIAKIRKAIRR
ncbi:MAG: hypothetical protein HWD59_01905 [Coxiellaceae bacterium]|nr:MAG: hypothetical protein HWD59_01905 [Coxiellaceae bacterium]